MNHSLHWLLHWLADAFIVIAVAKLVPGVKVKGFGTALWVSLLVGALGVLLFPLFALFGLPLVALGLTIVVRFLANTVALWIADKVTKGFEIQSVGTLFLTSLVMSVLHAIVLSVLR